MRGLAGAGSLKSMETLADRIRLVRDWTKLDQDAFGEPLSVTRGAVGNWELGKGVKLANLIAIAEKYGVSLEWLVMGRGTMFPPPERPEVGPGFSDAFGLIDAYDQRVSAGPGAFVTVGGEPMYQLAFRREWLRTITLAPERSLVILFADGDSMEPTIRPGDSMLVDTSQTNPRRDGIFVIRWDGWLNVKRVTADEASRTLTISSDNPQYAPRSDVQPDNITVLGRVVWIGRRVV